MSTRNGAARGSRSTSSLIPRPEQTKKTRGGGAEAGRNRRESDPPKPTSAGVAAANPKKAPGAAAGAVRQPAHSKQLVNGDAAAARRRAGGPPVTGFAATAAVAKAAKEENVDACNGGISLQPPPKGRRQRVLSVVSEEEQPTDDKGAAAAAKDERNAAAAAADHEKRPGAAAVADAIPARLVVKHFEQEPLVSPIPLPADVICIDPHDDHMMAYGPEMTKYMRNKEHGWVMTPDDILNGHERKKSLQRRRAILTDWLVGVCHYSKFSQETLYLSIALLDRTFAERTVEDDTLQLIGCSVVLIASKLEEYFPPSVADLVKLTDQTYASSTILRMERTLLNLFNFDVIAPEPMFFLRRFLRAADLGDNGARLVTETCTLLIDGTITTIEYSSLSPSFKAAASVLGALVILNVELENFLGHLWSPSLVYYTGYAETEAIELAYKMLFILQKVITADEASPHIAVRHKYVSKSLHMGLLGMAAFQAANVSRALRKVMERRDALGLPCLAARD